VREEASVPIWILGGVAAGPNPRLVRWMPVEGQAQTAPVGIEGQPAAREGVASPQRAQSRTMV